MWNYVLISSFIGFTIHYDIGIFPTYQSVLCKIVPEFHLTQYDGLNTIAFPLEKVSFEVSNTGFSSKQCAV